MLKILIKVVIVLGIVWAALVYANYLKTGHFNAYILNTKTRDLLNSLKTPQLSMPDISLPQTIPQLSQQHAKAAYKWRNAQGNWQYTSQPPPANTPYTRIDPIETTDID